MEYVGRLFTELDIPLIYLALYVGAVTLILIFDRTDFLLIVSYVYVILYVLTIGLFSGNLPP